MVEQAKAKFAKLDANHSGYLEKDELTGVVSAWAEAFGRTNNLNSKDIIDEIITRMDVDQDGRINFKEFIELFDEVMVKKPLVHSHAHHDVQVESKMW
jgi:Ca2+-binding EF-hand superfamily protein